MLKILSAIVIVVVRWYPVVSLDDQFKINGSIFLVSKIMTTEQSGE